MPDTDPLSILAADVTPVAPDPSFATALRARLAHALGLPRGVVRMTTMTAPTQQRVPYPGALPYLAAADARAAIEFYRTVFGTTERVRMPGPDGTIGHAELQLGDSLIMLADEFPEMGVLSPKTVGGTPVTISVYVTDVDAVFDKAIEAGATVVRAVEDQFYGDRTGQFSDPFGHRWSVATHIEDVSGEEMARRAAAMGG
jgi:PhnB protein